LKYLSVCSGIEAASVAWGPLGFDPVAFSEIEPFPSAVLAHHYPTVPNWGDMMKWESWPDAIIDVLVGGTPCQSFSVAGFRKGLADPRGNLALTYLAIADRYRPRWIVWENVPGVLSSVSHAAPDPCAPPAPLDVGRDGATVETDDEYDGEELHAFGCFLAGLSELGYGVAYGTLDAQYFGLAQRRERVFVVGYLGDWRRSSAVLLERGSLSGDPSPRREAWEKIAGTLGGSSQSGGFRTTDLDNSGAFIPEISRDVETAGTLDAGDGSATQRAVESSRLIPVETAHSLDAYSAGRATEDGTGRGCPLIPTGDVIAFDTTQITHPANRSNPQPGGTSPQLAAAAHAPTIAFSVKDHGGDATEELSPTLRSGNEINANASGGVMPAIAFEPRVASGRREGKIGDTAGPLTKESDRGDGFPCVAYGVHSDHSVAMRGNGSAEVAYETDRARALDTNGGFAHSQGGTVVAARAVAYGIGSHAGAADAEVSNKNHASGGPAGMGIQEECSHSMRAGRVPAVASFQEGGEESVGFYAQGGTQGISADTTAPSLKVGNGNAGHQIAVASFQESQSGARVGETHPTLDAHNGSRRHQGVVGFADVADPVAANQARTYTREGAGNFRMSNVAHSAVQVRRLTPRECERLQGFPDDYTLIPYRRKLAADGPRYKALGNSMAVPVMRWIGERIAMVDEIEPEE